MSLLEIKNLKVRVEDREILKGINLTLNAGEVHSIMGPNGSGKRRGVTGASGSDSIAVFHSPCGLVRALYGTS